MGYHWKHMGILHFVCRRWTWITDIAWKARPVQTKIVKTKKEREFLISWFSCPQQSKWLQHREFEMLCEFLICCHQAPAAPTLPTMRILCVSVVVAIRWQRCHCKWKVKSTTPMTVSYTLPSFQLWCRWVTNCLITERIENTDLTDSR